MYSVPTATNLGTNNTFLSWLAPLLCKKWDFLYEMLLSETACI